MPQQIHEAVKLSPKVYRWLETLVESGEYLTVDAAAIGLLLQLKKVLDS